MEYKTIDGTTTVEYVERRSRFIAVARRVDSVDEGLEFVKEVKKTYKEATHYPYAILSVPTDNSQKLSDDGEPQGTSGAPIMSAIKGRGFAGLALVVVRYFGGVKLGAGGLTMAYGKAAKMCLDQAQELLGVESAIVRVTVDYDAMSKIEKRLTVQEKIVDREFSNGVTLTIATAQKERLATIVREATSGKCEVEYIGTQVIFYK